LFQGNHKAGDNVFGAEVEFRCPAGTGKENPIKFQLGGSHKFSDTLTGRVKLDNELNLSGAAKWKYSSLFSVTGSWQFALRKGLGAVDFTKFPPLPLGYQIDLNI
jgi:hypothetical protein